VIAAALATVGIWTYQLIWPAPQPVPAVITETMEAEREQAAIREEQLRQAAADTQAKLEAAEGEQQRLKDEVQRQTKVATDADTKRQAAEKAAADADSKRTATEAQQQQLKDQVQRLTTTAADADTKRRAAESERQRLADELSKVRTEAATKQVALPQVTSSASTGPTGLFTIHTNAEAGRTIGAEYHATAETVHDCEKMCSVSLRCKVFSYNKAAKKSAISTFRRISHQMYSLTQAYVNNIR
jgi:hypothetical protein